MEWGQVRGCITEWLPKNVWTWQSICPPDFLYLYISPDSSSSKSQVKVWVWVTTNKHRLQTNVVISRCENKCCTGVLPMFTESRFSIHTFESRITQRITRVDDIQAMPVRLFVNNINRRRRTFHLSFGNRTGVKGRRAGPWFIWCGQYLK